MMRRVLIGIFCTIALTAVTVSVPAQEPARMTLSQRLQQLRRGLLSRGEEEVEPVQEAPRVAELPGRALPLKKSPENRETITRQRTGRYPRVDGSRLLPPEYEIRRQLKLEEVLGSRRSDATNEPRLAELGDEQRRGGDKVVSDSEAGETQPTLLPVESGDVETFADASAESSSADIGEGDVNREADTTAAAPVASQDRAIAELDRDGEARRSPGQAGRYDFDPSELRRELVRDGAQTESGPQTLATKDASVVGRDKSVEEREIVSEAPKQSAPAKIAENNSDIDAQAASTSAVATNEELTEPAGEQDPPILLNAQQPMPTVADDTGTVSSSETVPGPALTTGPALSGVESGPNDVTDNATEEGSLPSGDRYSTPRIANSQPGNPLPNPFAQQPTTSAPESHGGEAIVSDAAGVPSYGLQGPNYQPVISRSIPAPRDGEQVRLNGMNAFEPQSGGETRHTEQ